MYWKDKATTCHPKRRSTRRANLIEEPKKHLSIKCNINNNRRIIGILFERFDDLLSLLWRLIMKFYVIWIHFLRTYTYFLVMKWILKVNTFYSCFENVWISILTYSTVYRNNKCAFWRRCVYFLISRFDVHRWTYGLFQFCSYLAQTDINCAIIFGNKWEDFGLSAALLPALYTFIGFDDTVGLKWGIDQSVHTPFLVLCSYFFTNITG